MKTIWKFELELTDRQSIIMPTGAQILSVQMQSVGGRVPGLYVWALVDGSVTGSEEPREFAVIGTGNPCWCDGWDFVGTVQERCFVWHVFTKPQK